MLDQAVYTRCRPCRDILTDGSVLDRDGYGFFSFSEEILRTFLPPREESSPGGRPPPAART